MNVACYFDYTCGYSYRIFRLFESISQIQPEFTWRTFLLKDVNRPGDEPSFFSRERIESVGLLALALAHAARAADFGRYHASVFEAMHGQQRRLGRDDVCELAVEAGVDLGAFRRDEKQWIDAVAREHTGGVDRWGVFGTPTLIIGDESAVYLKLSHVPPSVDARVEFWEALRTLSVAYPEVVEIKRPNLERGRD